MSSAPGVTVLSVTGWELPGRVARPLSDTPATVARSTAAPNATSAGSQDFTCDPTPEAAAG